MKLETTVDLEIALLIASNFRIESATRFDKMMFLLYNTGLFDECFTEMLKEGISYKYGPFVFTLLEDLAALEETSLIAWTDQIYTLTTGYRMMLSASKIYLKSILDWSVIQMIASLCNSMELNDLLKYVYSLKHESA